MLMMLVEKLKSKISNFIKKVIQVTIVVPRIEKEFRLDASKCGVKRQYSYREERV